MKPIIIATSNIDKFDLTVNILRAMDVKPDKFLNLADLNIVNDQPEIGGIMERAKQKALYCLSKIKSEDYSKYGCVIANDTGTRLPTINLVTEESRKLASEILAGNHIKAGDPMIYIYAYVVILLPHLDMLTAIAEVPFTYLGNPKGITLEEGKNTMGLVKAIPGQNIPHAFVPAKEETSYRLGYLRNALEPLVDRIKKIV